MYGRMEDGGGVVRVKKDEVSGRLVVIVQMCVGGISFAGGLHLSTGVVS